MKFLLADLTAFVVAIIGIFDRHSLRNFNDTNLFNNMFRSMLNGLFMIISGLITVLTLGAVVPLKSFILESATRRYYKD